MSRRIVVGCKVVVDVGCVSDVVVEGNIVVVVATVVVVVGAGVVVVVSADAIWQIYCSDAGLLKGTVTHEPSEFMAMYPAVVGVNPAGEKSNCDSSNQYFWNVPDNSITYPPRIPGNETSCRAAAFSDNEWIEDGTWFSASHSVLETKKHWPSAHERPHDVHTHTASTDSKRRVRQRIDACTRIRIELLGVLANVTRERTTFSKNQKTNETSETKSQGISWCIGA